jgi:CheY-like chemotaxis protein
MLNPMAPDSPESGQPVLIVEDDEAVREAMREALEEEGYPTLSAADGERALELLAKGPRPRLILLDLMMPVMNGWELLKVLRASAALARIPVVILSSASGSPAPHGVPSVKKPISVQSLLRLVDEYAD